MSRLVRARPKAAEYLPEWAKCCDTQIRVTRSFGDMTVDLDSLHFHPGGDCTYCGAEWPGFKQVIDVADGMGVGIEMIDLDEGPLEP